ncbi:Dabb family protein [Mycolicibacterium goodii]|uniref:Dabb family protein n=1 Tax=Mycolicibacterium goodii TaxID=134601 RepID=UPI00296FFCF2
MSFRWHAGITAEQIAALTVALTALPSQIPVLLSYRFGPDLGLREGNADYAVVALLRNPRDVDTYLDHPAHIEVMRQYTRVMAAERSAVQFTVHEEDLDR